MAENTTTILIGDPENEETGNITVTGGSGADAGEGILLYLESKTPDGAITITGTVTSANGAPALMTVGRESFNITEDNVAELLPEITVFELAPADGETFIGNTELNSGTPRVVTDQNDPIVKAIAEAIQYIVKIADDSKDKVTVSGTSTGSNGLTVAKENDKLQVQVSAGDGMEIESLTAGDYATVTKNGDGTWTITVVRGGGIVISAKLSTGGSSLYDSIGQYFLYGKRLPEGANPETDEKEDLVWRCIGIYSGYAKLALVRGYESMPEDFAESFTEEEMAGIKDGEIKELEAEKVERLFHDELVHPVILVDVWSLGIW